MKRKCSIILAVLLTALSSAGCQTSDNSSSAETPVSVSESAETIPAEASAEQSTSSAQGGPPQAELNLDAQFDESKLLNYVDMPSCSVDAEAQESDFAGFWVADVMTKDNIAYDKICGIPVSATGHLVIESGSGKFINIRPVVVSNSPQAEQNQSAEAEETELPLTYVFENGVLNASVTISVGSAGNRQGVPDAMQGIGAETSAVQGQPMKQMTLQMTDDGRILVQSADASGAVTSAYYRKTDSFEEFDWSAVQFDFESVYGG